MKSESEYYGLFVMYNGMKKSCEYSTKSSGFLLQALYSVVDVKNSTKYFMNGIRDYIRKASDKEIMSIFSVTEDQIRDCIEGNEWVLKQENLTFFRSSNEAFKKKMQFNQIEKYKNLEITKSIIFKHLKISY